MINKPTFKRYTDLNLSAEKLKTVARLSHVINSVDPSMETLLAYDAEVHKAANELMALQELMYDNQMPDDKWSVVPTLVDFLASKMNEHMWLDGYMNICLTRRNQSTDTVVSN